MKTEQNFAPLGTIENPIADSEMSYEEAVWMNLDPECPEEIIERQVVVPVTYLSFDGKIHRGQIVIDERIEQDIYKLFQYMLEQGFPVEKVVPISHPDFLKEGRWNDELSMKNNNTSGFNYKKIADKDKLSLHALGLAFDINTWLNPHVRRSSTLPEGATYDPFVPGTLTAEHPIVVYAETVLGLKWGGKWKISEEDPHQGPDYQHFYKEVEDLKEFVS